MEDRIWDKLSSRIDGFAKTELSNLVQRFEKERRLLDSIFGLLKEAILLVDETGRIEFFNNSATYILGLNKKDKSKISLWKLIPELTSFFSRNTCNLTPDVISKEVFLSYPEERLLRLYMQPFDSEFEEKTRYIVILTDITDEKKASEELIAKEKFNSIISLASEVAHELGNPLNSINIHLQLISKKCSDSNVSSKILDSIKICSEEVNRLDDIIKNFLKAVKPRELDMQSKNIISLIEKVLSVLAPQLQNLNIKVELDSNEKIPNVKIDSSRMHQALFNLLKNSIEAIGSDGCIKISIREESDYLIVAIADSGHGISAKKAAFVLNKNESTKPSGNGIGMMVVRRIIQEHGGKLEFESKSNIGTIVYVKIPLLNRKIKLLASNKK